ncbi:MAG: aminoglycoside phosphotransferase family protein [Candidatus Omnitrophica bacterium]|nr:aminoglycoside phosphotransferase family protein [Candidatus Omnitrophota bacterium]
MRRLVAICLVVFPTASPVSRSSSLSSLSLRQIEGVEAGLEEQLSFSLRSESPDFSAPESFSAAASGAAPAGLEENFDADEANRVFANLRQFETEGEFTSGDSTVSVISHGRVNRVYLVERNDGVKLIAFRLNPVWNFPALDRNHFRFEAKQKEALDGGLLPDGWKPVHFLNRKGVRSKLYQQEDGAHWRFMQFTEGLVIQSIDEIPSEKHLAAAGRFGRLLVQFRRMLELPSGGDFEDSLPNFQDIAYHLEHYDRVLRGEEVRVSLSSDPAQTARLDPSRRFGQDGHGNFSARNAALQHAIAQFRDVIAPLLSGLKKVPTHGDPKIDNVFWEVNAAGEWMPLAIGDLDTLQPGHETLDIADAARVLAFEGGENADPGHLVVLKEVVESIVNGWLSEIEQVYGPAERQRLEPFVYPSIAAVYFTLAVRFHDSFLTGDSYFEALSRYRQNVPDPGKYLRAAEIQMAQFRAFVQAFADQPGMQPLVGLTAQAGLEDRRVPVPTVAFAGAAGVGQGSVAGQGASGEMGSLQPQGIGTGVGGEPVEIWTPPEGSPLHGRIIVHRDPETGATTTILKTSLSGYFLINDLPIPRSQTTNQSLYVFNPEDANLGVIAERMANQESVVAIIARDKAQADYLQEKLGFGGMIVRLDEAANLDAAYDIALKQAEKRMGGREAILHVYDPTRSARWILSFLQEQELDQKVSLKEVEQWVGAVAHMRAA